MRKPRTRTRPQLGCVVFVLFHGGLVEALSHCGGTFRISQVSPISRRRESHRSQTNHHHCHHVFCRRRPLHETATDIDATNVYLGNESDLSAVHVNGNMTLKEGQGSLDTTTTSTDATPHPPIHDHITGFDKFMIASTLVLFILSFAGLLSASGPNGWRYFLAGGICASAAHAIATPIDVVKTRKQVDPTLMNKGFVQATVRIVRKEGLNTLLAGLGPTTLGYLVEGAFKFGTYEVTKPAVHRLLCWFTQTTTLTFLSSKLMGYMVCGSISGVAASALLCPMEAIRIRLVAEPDFAPRGWIQGGYLMLKKEGVSSMSKGMTSMIYKQVPYTVAKNGGFDFVTKLCYGILRNSGVAFTHGVKVGVPVLAALFASVISTIASQPGDLLLSLVNAHEGDKRTNDFVREIVSSHRGLAGFFVGIKTRFLHLGIIVTGQLLIYEFIKRLCGIAATGSV